MIKIGDIQLTKQQQEVIISALCKYDDSLKSLILSKELLKDKVKTLKDISDLIFNEKKKERENKPKIEDYYMNGNYPIKCFDCGNTHIEAKVQLRADSGPSEISYICTQCGNECAYWAHGEFDPIYRLAVVESLKQDIDLHVISI